MRYRVWWETDFKLRYFYVKNIKEASICITTLIIREMDDDDIEFNIYGLECSKDGVDWKEWVSENGEIISEIENPYFDFMFEGKM